MFLESRHYIALELWNCPIFVIIVNILKPHPSTQKMLVIEYEESSKNALNVCNNKHWIGEWVVNKIWINNMIILLIQHKSYILVMMTLFMTSWWQNQFENYVKAILTRNQQWSICCLIRLWDILNYFYF